MNKKIWVALFALLCLTCGGLEAKAQADDVPKYEVGIHFTSITKPDFSNGATEPGFGGRFTYNINSSVAIEAVGNFFPHSCRFCGDNSGNISQGLAGVKAGKRFEKWGIFGKARPGIVSFSKGDGDYFLAGSGPLVSSSLPPPFEFRQKRLNTAALDLGGVLEFYPTRKIVTRFEAGDTLIHYGERQFNVPSFDGTGTFSLIPITTRSETRHNFQFSAGVGFRF